jgi:hypothetical protein
MRLSRSQCANIETWRLERGDYRGIIDLGVMGKGNKRAAGAKWVLGKRLVRPGI